MISGKVAVQRVLHFLFLFVSCAMPSVARQTSATEAALVGTVRDAAGHALVGVAIVARHLATGQERRTTSDEQGAYRLAPLAVGEYEVRAEAEGFARYINGVVVLSVGRATQLDIVLEPSRVSAEVTVAARTLPLDPTQTALATSIEPEQIAELPVNSRNYLEFALLAAGVAPANPATGSVPDGGFSFGGLRPRSNAIAIDGLENTDETTGSARIALSPEIVREFQVINSGTSAEFGGAAGGTINVVTKTGSNELHGDLFLFAQNERFNAQSAGPPRRRFRRYQPGGSLGGPLKRDRVFYYLAVERESLVEEEASDVGADVRAAINRVLLSDARFAVYEPLVDRVAVMRRETEAAAKLTLLLTDRHTLHVRYALSDDLKRNERTSGDLPDDRSARATEIVRDRQLTANLISALSTRLANELRAQRSVRRAQLAPVALRPRIEIVGLARFGLPAGLLGARHETHSQLADVLTVGRARSEWKTGINVARIALRSELNEDFGGLFVFRTLDDLRAGRPALWRQAFGEARTVIRPLVFGLFLLDQWRAAQNLTLNLGARYDTETVPVRAQRVSPRLGFVWSPAEKWVARANFGLFQDRLPLAFINRAVQQNGQRAFLQWAARQAAEQVLAAAGARRYDYPPLALAPSIYRLDSLSPAPYSLQIGAGFQRLIAAVASARIEYLWVRGLHLARTRNVNLLPPVVLTPTNARALGVRDPTPQQLGRLVFGPERRDARYDAVYQLEDSARSSYQGMTLALERRFADEFACTASYTLSRVIDDASDFDEQPQNPFDLRRERALSRQDLRHRFVLSALFELPLEERSGPLRHIEIAPILTLNSGRPVNPLTGDDEEQGRAFPLSSRPLGAQRNSLRTPGTVEFDLRALKYFPFGSARRLDLVVEVFNLFNRRNVRTINPFHGSGPSPLASLAAPVWLAPRRQLRLSVDLEF